MNKLTIKTSIIPVCLLLTALCFTQPLNAEDFAPAPFTIAFFYAANPPLSELQAFDIAVVDPDSLTAPPKDYQTTHSQLFAYVSVGEAEPYRRFFKQIDPSWMIAENSNWGTRVVDLANPAWRDFFLDQVIEPLWTAGYRGFFLDTLDSYQLVQDKKRIPGLEEGLIAIIRGIKSRHPEAKLIMNRGFEVLERVKDIAFAVAAESLFQNFEPSSGQYGEVKENDRQWLTNRLNEAKSAGLPVIAIDYVKPSERELARKTADKIKQLGFIPWVTDKDISSMGVGAVEVMPRTILGLYDGSEAQDPVYLALHRVAVMPLNYLGYQVELRDMRTSLPEGALAGRYAGVVVWPNSYESGNNGLMKWVKARVDEGVKVVFLERFGVPCQIFAKEMGLGHGSTGTPNQKLHILKRTDEVGFEAEPVPLMGTFCPLQVNDGKVLLSVGDGKRLRSDAVAITPWGGYALESYFLTDALANQTRWIVNPFSFFQQALNLTPQPAPDTTTENGLRLLLSHIDGDGFESLSEWPGGRYAGIELREKILKKYRIPTTFSVITSTMGDHGLNPAQAPTLQNEAREIFKLPWIEAGSHTFSHPFYWQNTDVAKADYDAQYLPIPGYVFNLDDEIAGSIRFMEQTLLPKDKKVKVLQWSGDCIPGTDALALVHRSGVRNINGGDTGILDSNNSLTRVAPLGVEKSGLFQVFAPNQNENDYTGNWTGPFYGYRRVIETFRLTDSPRRLKPVNIYYHVYSLTKLASLKALEEAYDWALARKPHAIFTSEYIDKVIDFNRTVIARDGKGWLIRNSGDLRQVRLPASAGYPDLAASHNILGFNDHGDSRYIHLGPGGEARLVMRQQPPSSPWLESAGGTVTAFEQTAKGMRLTLRSHLSTDVSFGGATNCHVTSGNISGQSGTEGSFKSITVAPGSHGLELVCK